MRRRPEHEHADVFFDVVEAMLDARRDEDEAAGLHRPVFTGDLDHRSPADHVVHLVLSVRTLAVDRARGPDGKAHAQLLGGEKVDIPMTLVVARLRVELGDLVRFQLVTGSSRCHVPAAMNTDATRPSPARLKTTFSPDSRSPGSTRKTSESLVAISVGRQAGSSGLRI